MHQPHSFARVPEVNIPRSVFDLSHRHLTTFDAGYLVPILSQEVYPGDTFFLDMTVFGRLATPIFPVMDNLFLDSFFFFVPHRLLWTTTGANGTWEKFMGEQDNPGDSIDFLIPQVVAPAGGWLENTVYDYFGFPTKVAGISVSAFKLRAYNQIWNDWFRDENLQTSAVVLRGDGPDPQTSYTLLRRGKRHDYFTSSLPFPQKGAAVSLPLGTQAPVIRANNATYVNLFNQGTNTTAANGALTVSGGSLSNGAQLLSLDPRGGLYADLSAATAATINQLRQAFSIQTLYERDARGGTRYTELVRSHFGVVSPDARLQRPEYLGGGSTMINIHPVAQTSATPSQPTPQGNLSAFGTLSAFNHGFTKSFTEHGVIIGLVSVRAELSYQQGISRYDSRRTRQDFYFPALAQLGEQAVLNKEIYAQGSAAPTVDVAAFGYQEAWADLRYKSSLVTGSFRSNAAQTLDSWHLSQYFTALPVLNSTFIQENPPVSRVLAVPSAPQFLFDAWFKFRAARPLPTYSIPANIGKF